MTRREVTLIAAFFICFLVLFSPLLGWYFFFVLGSQLVSPNGLGKTIAAVIGADSDTFNTLSIFMAPIGVLIAARISGAPNSPLVYLSAPFILALILAVVAPLTITPYVVENIAGLLANSSGADWAAKARITFGRYAESYASTSAVLLGLQLRNP
jgi:hypothetical protein